jgi:hypothetical protein
MMKCESCKREVRGEINVSSGVVRGVPVICLTSTPDRDWICCDRCNAIVCHDCCMHPESGYCDSCIASPELYSYLIDCGLIKEVAGESRKTQTSD